MLEQIPSCIGPWCSLSCEVVPVQRKNPVMKGFCRRFFGVPLAFKPSLFPITVANVLNNTWKSWQVPCFFPVDVCFVRTPIVMGISSSSTCSLVKSVKLYSGERRIQRLLHIYPASKRAKLILRFSPYSTTLGDPKFTLLAAFFAKVGVFNHVIYSSADPHWQQCGSAEE